MFDIKKEPWALFVHDDHFAFQMITGFFSDNLLDMLYQLKDIIAGGVVVVDDKAGMLFGNHGTADLIAFQSAVIDQLGSVGTARSLECGAGRRVFQRLFFDPSL